MRKKDKKSTKKDLKFYQILSVVLIVISAILTILLLYLDAIPTKYIMIILPSLLLFDIFVVLLLNIKKVKRKIKKFASVLSIFATIVMLIPIFFLATPLIHLWMNSSGGYKTENYSVIVLKSSKYEVLSDIKGETVGYYSNSTGSKKANDKLKEKVNVSFKSYTSADSLINDLLNSKINVILLEDSIKGVVEEEMPNFSSLIRILDDIPVKIEMESNEKDVNVTKDCFAIYISGIDTYGKISSVSRSDVNIVAVVNPKNKQVLLISIPRDYYVQLHGTTGSRDKLTHAGIYGIDMSIQTIEDLLDIDINYYLKVNFTSVIDIVDTLGGVDVYSEYSFISYSGYRFKKGYNTVNGEQALDFARTRKAFTDGDRQRGKNQQALIAAIIKKASDKSIIMKYNSLLNAIDGKYQTNMGIKKMTSLIKMQLNDMSPWSITSYSLTGTDSNNYTYTYNQLLYVMEPDKNSINEAKELISKLLNGDKLESFYNDVSEGSNKVTKVPATTPPTSKEPEVVTPPATTNTQTPSVTDNNTDDQNNTAGDEQDPDLDLPSIPSEDDEGGDDPKDNNDNNVDDPLEPIVPQDSEVSNEDLSLT